MDLYLLNDPADATASRRSTGNAAQTAQLAHKQASATCGLAGFFAAASTGAWAKQGTG